MSIRSRPPSPARVRAIVLLLVTAGCVLLPRVVAAQSLTGSLIGTVRDAQGGVLPGAVVRVTSPALIGGPATMTTNEKGQLRFLVLPPGRYVLEIEMPGFAAWREADILIGAGATLDRTAVMTLGARAESVVVEGSRLDARNPGVGVSFGPELLSAIPTRGAGWFDLIRAAPGVSPTSPTSGTITTLSVFGSGTNENMFLFDGTNFTCPCSGVARGEPGPGFIHEVQVQSIGASAEYGNMQGGVFNVITRQGSERFLYDAAYRAQTAGLTSRPVELPMLGSSQATSGYERARFRDFTTNLGGPLIRDRGWFFAGYQHLRDFDSQPGTDPAFPRQYAQDRSFAKLTWRLSPSLHLAQSLHYEVGISPDRPTIVTPFEALSQRRISVPAMTFGHLTQTLSASTVWDVRVGRFVYSHDDEFPTGDPTIPSRLERTTGVTSGAPSRMGSTTITRTTAKATMNHYRPSLWAGDHQLKIGAQLERGGHSGTATIPTGTRYVDNGGRKFQAISAAPSNIGGESLTASAFASDAVTIGDRLTISAGLRFDHSRAMTQDLPASDAQGHETDVIVQGAGTLYTWNILSPRLGMTLRLTDDGRTVMRASYGRFSQGVLTGEIEAFHPGATATRTMAFVEADNDYTRLVSEVDPRINLVPDRETRAPHTDEYSVGVDREVARGIAVAIAYVRKDGRDFLGWEDTAGQYVEEPFAIDGGSMTVFRLVSPARDRRFLLTNQGTYALDYNGMVIAVDKRRSGGWQAFGSYTFSKAQGLQASSGATAAGPQVSTVAPPNPIVFGRDPNDLTNARGRLPNDRPHMFRLMGSVDVPRTGLVLAGNLQHFSGKPWAASTQVLLTQGDIRVLLEPRGSRRLSSQTLLDLRLSRVIRVGNSGSVELLLDVLNALNDTAEEAIATDYLASPNFARPTLFIDPRRAMISVRLNLGR